MHRISWLVILALVLTPHLALPATAGEASQPGKADLTLTAEENGLVLDLSLPSYRMEEVIHEGIVYQKIVIDDQGWWPAGQPGAPSLPERGVMLAVPPTGEVTVQVLEAQPQQLDGTFRLAPRPTAALAGAGEETRVVEQWLADPAAYAEESGTPAGRAEITQEGWLRGYRFVRLSLRPFQFNPAHGELLAVPAMRVRVSFSQPGPTVAGQADPHFAPIFRASFANFDQAANWQIRPESQAIPAEAALGLNSTGPWVKVTVNADGLYRVTYTNLLAAGISSAVLNTLNPRTFRLLDAGQEQHIHVVGEADNVFNTTDSIVFYGRRNTQPLSDDNNVYWLTWGGANGLRMELQNAVPSGAPVATTLLTTAHAEQNMEYRQERPFVDWLQPVLYDNWYWSHVSTPMTVVFPGLKVNTSSSVAPVLSVWMAGYRRSPGNYTVSFALNGGPEQSRLWTNTRVLEGTVNLPAGALANGDNSVSVRPINVTGASTQDYTVWLDWLRLTYPYNGQYLSGAIFNNPDSGLWRYQITNVPADTPWVLNVGTPTQPKLLTNLAPSGGGPYTISWQRSTTAADRFLVVPDSEVRQPVAVTQFQGSTLLDGNQQVDYLMIVHSSLIAAAQPLAAMHSANGLSVRIVNVQEIYDLFSDGSLSADAIRNYLAYAYANYQAPAPTYVLLVGDGSVNYRGYSQPSIPTPRLSLIPPYMGGYDAWNGASFSDNGFVTVQGNDLLGEMIISRLPVNDPSETSTVVNKIVQYPYTFPQNRALNTLWIADNPDNDNPGFGTQFHIASEQTLATLQPQFQVDRVYFCTPDPGPNTCPPLPHIYTDVAQARAAIISKWSQGHSLLHYSGHGGLGAWAHEWLFIVNWTNQLTNGAALPFLLVSSCLTGYFAHPRYTGVDEGLLRAAGGGTIGGFTGVTFDTMPPQTMLLTNFMEAVMQDGITQPGPASAVARARTFAALPYPENERVAVGHGLTGDPAMALIEPDTCAPGDLNCDGVIDIVDLQRVAAAWNTVAWSVGYNPRADLVRDGQIDIHDITAIANLWNTPVR